MKERHTKEEAEFLTAEQEKRGLKEYEVNKGVAQGSCKSDKLEF